MSLPKEYTTSSQYFRDVLSFMKNYQWIYNYCNTDILAKNVLTNFSSEWIEFINGLSNEDFNSLPLGEVKETCPHDLKFFLNTIKSLKAQIIPKIYKCDYKMCHNSGLGNKKVHEILSLAPHVHEICQENDINFVIDVGAGLGYLSHLLSDKYGYPVLGIECSTQNVTLAYKNQDKFFLNLKDRVIFANHYIDKNSCEEIIKLTHQYFKSTPLQTGCITGLHACADLSVTILELFLKLDFARCLVIMPCCYHRINISEIDEEKEYFENFPVSIKLKKLFIEFEAEKFLRRPFLRLACQQTLDNFTNMGNDDHDTHSRNLMCRAILQKVANSEGYTVHRLKRKSGPKSKPSDPDQHFELYLNNLNNTHKLEKSERLPEKLSVCIDDETFMVKLREKWREHKSECRLVEALTGFQGSIQSICENLVLLDRVEFLKERGLECYVRKVTDDIVSPRSYAIVAVKD